MACYRGGLVAAAGKLAGLGGLRAGIDAEEA
jgi:hypothetical protein